MVGRDLGRPGPSPDDSLRIPPLEEITETAIA